jgi:predicted nuclease with TOPRIM domain
MTDPSSTSTTNGVANDIASIYQELATAEKTADALEDRLAILEQRLDELVKRLESEALEPTANA